MQLGHHPYSYQPYPLNPYIQHPSHFGYDQHYFGEPFDMQRQQQPVRGQASWTEGGQVTQCGIPWSANRYMTAAVGENTPFRCGQTLRVINVSSPEAKEITVTIVDVVPGYPPNKLNLHRRAFEALGADPDLGVINVEFFPTTEEEEGVWGRYLVGITQSAYPGHQITDYRFVEKNEVSADQTRETYEFNLQGPQGEITVQSNVLYNPRTNRVISFDVKEV